MRFIEPTIEYEEQIRIYRQEFLDTGSSMDGTGALRRMEDPKQWIEHSLNSMKKETVPDGLVPATQMLQHGLEKCKELGIYKVLITCDYDNEGSRKTILKNGGVYESTVHEPDEDIDLQRYWIEI